MIEAATNLRNAWHESAAAEIARRERMEAGRGQLRVLMRAWREVCDDVRAGAAQWDARWEAERPGDCTLARRLTFDGEGSVWEAEEGWRMRMVLAWQRLVAGGRVRVARRRSSAWQAAERRKMEATAQRAMWPGAEEVREAAELQLARSVMSKGEELALHEAPHTPHCTRCSQWCSGTAREPRAAAVAKVARRRGERRAEEADEKAAAAYRAGEADAGASGTAPHITNGTAHVARR